MKETLKVAIVQTTLDNKAAWKIDKKIIRADDKEAERV